MAAELLYELLNSEQFQLYYNISLTYANEVRLLINKNCEGKEAWQVIGGTFFGTLLLVWIYKFLFKDESIGVRLKKFTFKTVRSLPIVSGVIKSKIDKTGKDLHDSTKKLMSGAKYFHQLPKTGLKEDEILKLVKSYAALGSVDWSKGKASGTVYNGNEELTNIMTTVYGITAWTNPLHADVFPGIISMESQVLRMVCNLFNGGPETCGSMTTGGTESIFMACKAYRDYAREKKGITKPEMVISTSTHAGFLKSALILKIKVITVPVNPVTMKCDVRGMKRAITKNTIMMAVSAPQYPHGIVDHIPEVSELGLKYDIPVHVDACLGGFLIVFMEKAGFPIIKFDFRLPGVTSISADTHKYGYAPKGSSIILYRNKEYRHYQYFVSTEWSGGVYATTTISGSRAGAIVAACWAALMFHGEEKYVALTKDVLTTTKYLISKLKKIKGIHLVGEPEVSVISFGSNDFNIYTFLEEMGNKGWNLNALQFPACIHIAVTVVHTRPGVADTFIADVTEIANKLCGKPKTSAEGSAAVYGFAQAIPDRSIVSEVTWHYLDALTATPTS